MESGKEVEPALLRRPGGFGSRAGHGPWTSARGGAFGRQRVKATGSSVSLTGGTSVPTTSGSVVSLGARFAA